MYLLFDIGGTHSRFAVSKDYQSLGEVKVINTPQSFEEALREYQKVISDLTKGERVTGASGGVAGPLDKTKSMLINSPHLSEWIQKPFKEELQKIVDAPVFLENDASLAGLGEAVFGAGKDKEIIAYLTISTGVGGARIIDGKIDRSSLGFEPGHQILEISSKVELEGLISGTALEKKYQRKPEEITEEEVWEEVSKTLAVGLHNLAVFWSPEIIILGGSVSKSLPLEKVVYYFKEYSQIFPTLPEVTKSKLVDYSGLYGALAYLNQKNS